MVVFFVNQIGCLEWPLIITLSQEDQTTNHIHARVNLSIQFVFWLFHVQPTSRRDEQFLSPFIKSLFKHNRLILLLNKVCKSDMVKIFRGSCYRCFRCSGECVLLTAQEERALFLKKSFLEHTLNLLPGVAICSSYICASFKISFTSFFHN